MPKAEVKITEIAEFEPERVDGVGKGANGFPILMLKSIDTEVDTLDDVTTPTATKAADAADRKDCETCAGEGKILQGNRDCPDCKATGKAPKIGESMKQFLENVAKESEGTAPSGSGPTPAADCPTCSGYGKINNGSFDSLDCPDCGGTGKDQATTNPAELKTMAADAGRVSVGDPQGREKIDKAAADSCPGCDKAMSNGSNYCAQCGAKVQKGSDFDVDGFRPSNYRPDPDETVQCPKCECMNDTDAAYCDQCGHQLAGDNKVVTVKADATKADGVVTDGGATFSGMNPAVSATTDTTLANITGDATADDGGPGPLDPVPGSPEWEAFDAATATQAAQALMQAAELSRTFAQRESIEVAAGEGNDIYDAKAAAVAMAGVSDALGIMAQLAFHEGLEATKGLEDGDAAKAGKRLSGKSVAALAAARDHLNLVLGNDDPALAEDDDDDSKQSGKSAASKYIASANKALLTEEIDTMSTDELEKVLDARDERLVELIADAIKGKSADDQAASVANAKGENADSKKKKPKADVTDLEDESDAEGDNDSASGVNQAVGAAKAEADVTDAEPVAELTEEEIAAKQAAKEAKQALKAARKAEKEAAENAAVAKAIAEGVAEATEAVRTLQERLATVEKMAAPSNIVRTRPQEDMTKSVERDELEMRLAQLERTARETPDNDIRKASREQAAEIRTKITSLSA